MNSVSGSGSSGTGTKHSVQKPGGRAAGLRRGETKSSGTVRGGGILAMWLGMSGMRWFTPCEGCEGSDVSSGMRDEVVVGSLKMISFHLYVSAMSDNTGRRGRKRLT